MEKYIAVVKIAQEISVMYLEDIGIAEMIKIVEKDITDVEFLKDNHINAIVNAAKPTLMGSNQGVDGAIHKIINSNPEEEKEYSYWICQELETEEKENIIRCKRGEAVITSGRSLCQYIIHAVGAKYDGESDKSEVPSSSRIQVLEKCYFEIIHLIKKKDIKNIAIPVIGSGEYKFPFDLAVRIAIGSIGNALVEWYKQDTEIFEMSDLENIYLCIYNSDNQERQKNYQTAKHIFNMYELILRNNKKVVFQSSIKSHAQYIKEISKYDRIKGYFSVARMVRLGMMYFRWMFFPEMWLKDKIGECDWESRRCFVEIFAFLKMFFPIVLMGINIFGVVSDMKLVILLVYAMSDTITYLLTLMLMADIQRPSANVIRSMIMLLVNFIEISMEMACLYLINYYDKISRLEAIAFGVLGVQSEKIDLCGWADYIFVYADAGIKFFFASLVFGYFSNHMTQRRFQS